MADYIVKKETLSGLANAIRSITGTTELISLNDMTTIIKSLTLGNDNNSSKIYVGMMEPYPTVGKDGDIFFLV